jgi:hypothetical protein
MNIFIVILAAIFIPLAVLYCHRVGRHKKSGFWGSLLILIFCTPFFGFLIIEGLPLKNPQGCVWCGNKSNEAEYCGVCGKNIHGEIRNATKATAL